MSQINHIRFSKATLSRIQNQTGKQAACCSCGEPFKKDDEGLSILETNNPHKRKYCCQKCFVEEAKKAG